MARRLPSRRASIAKPLITLAEARQLKRQWDAIGKDIRKLAVKVRALRGEMQDAMAAARRAIRPKTPQMQMDFVKERAAALQRIERARQKYLRQRSK